MIYILYGIAGVGKTTIGKLLAEKLELPFYDADDFHPQSNIEKMKNGIPLQDEDREGWLSILAENVEKWDKEKGAVIACSALKEKYRKKLQRIPREKMMWIFLNSTYELILSRVKNRKEHYFNPDLLQSQYDSLELADYGLHIDVNQSIDAILDEILSEINKPKSEIGLLGLGVMGKSLAINMASKGIKVSVYNRQVAQLEVDIAKTFAEENKDIYEFPWFQELESFVASLAKPRNIFLMVNAGKTVDIVIESLLPLLEKNDLIIDGGNSHYKETIRRQKMLKNKGILFMGTGISGGEEGARKGPSIMPGGSPKSYERVGGMLEKIAARDSQGNPCCTYVGSDGAGHFVKMLHNGIEYGEMELIAEVYHFLRFTVGKSLPEISEIFNQWNKEMQSYLLEISAEILNVKEGDDFLINKILDAASQKGTGGWSTNTALELGVPFDTITAAVMARNISAKKEERMKAAKLYDFSKTSDDFDLKQLFTAYKTASIINHSIGFDLLIEASRQYSWNLNLSEIARIWTNGCIIRSAFMQELVGLFAQNPMTHILLNKKISQEVKNHRGTLVDFVASALGSGCPASVFSAAANYLLSYTSEETSANMIQAQRDFFGAHTFERTDKPRGEYFHAHWNTNK